MIDLISWRKEHQLDRIVATNLSSLSQRENRGYDNAILLIKSLPKDYVDHLSKEKCDGTVFHELECEVNELADKLAEDIVKEGYEAISQSERGIGERGEFDFDTKTSLLPHKTIAVLAGIGWIGKNNLLVTESYGPAFCMCSVLTNAPVETKKSEIVMSKCGECSLCVKVCPPKVLHGTTWNLHTKRDEIVDVYHCQGCLKCLGKCRYSIRYARS